MAASNRHHRVAGAGNIAHPHRIGRHVDGRALAHQRHAGFAARHQHRLRAEFTAELGRRRRDLVVGLRRRVGRVGKFLPVRRDHGGAAIDAVVAAFRIDNHRLAELVGGIDDGADDARGERALGVVGQHHRAHARHRLDGMADQRVLAGRIDGRGHVPNRRAAYGWNDAPTRSGPCAWSAAPRRPPDGIRSADGWPRPRSARARHRRRRPRRRKCSACRARPDCAPRCRRRRPSLRCA